MDKAKTSSHSDAVLKYMEDMSVANCCKFLRKRINSTKRKILKGINDGADDASNKDESTGKKEKKQKLLMRVRALGTKIFNVCSLCVPVWRGHLHCVFPWLVLLLDASHCPSTTHLDMFSLIF
jgi:hypothetical protein